MRAARFGRAAVVAAVVTVAVGVTAPWSAAGKPANDAQRIIIDTDLSKWWDDASTIGIANVLHNDGEIEILGIVSDVKNDIAVAALDALNTGYGNDKIPLGAVEGSDEDSFDHGYTDDLIAALPHSVKSSADVPDAVALYRKLLTKQPNGSVTIVSLGGFSNLAGLLESGPGQGSKLDGRDLIAKKVDRLVQMDGLFPGNDDAPPYTNQEIDLPAATAVVEGDWPTPIAWVDGLPGIRARVGGTLCTTVSAEHPMRVVYEILFECGEPGDGNWDAPAFLYAIGDQPEIWEELGQGGAAAIAANGGLKWVLPSDRPDDLYVHVFDQDALNARIDELLEVE